MKIPESLKVGAKTYAVKVTDNISMGLDYSAEIDYAKLEINIRPMAQSKMEHDFLHEMVHAMLNFNGHSSHNEEEVDRMAAVLHMIISDNPGIFEKEGG